MVMELNPVEETISVDLLGLPEVYNDNLHHESINAQFPKSPHYFVNVHKKSLLFIEIHKK